MRFTPSEIEKIEKGEQLLHASDREPFREQREEERKLAKAKREQAGQEEDAERWERYKAKVRREGAEKAEQQQLEDEAIRAMSPAEYDAWKKRVPAALQLAPKFPPRYMMAVEDNRRDDAKAATAAREQREHDLCLPKAQAEHAPRWRSSARSASRPKPRPTRPR
jgi:hypothetical protein